MLATPLDWRTGHGRLREDTGYGAAFGKFEKSQISAAFILYAGCK
jgi:hypothetical protein